MDEITPITVNFTAKSVAAISEAMARTPHSQTDLHNRAVQIYNYLDQVWSEGGEVFIRRNGDDEAEKLNVW